jgi:choline kinase
MVREAVGGWFPGLDVTYVINPDYQTTNNAYSLLLMRDHVEHDGFILLDGDVVFDLGVVEELIERGPDCLAVRSVGEIGLEEVKVTADNEDRVLAIGKHVPVRSAMGESVGIELFSAASSKKLFAALHQRVREHGLVNEYYEAAFQQIIDAGVTLYGVDIGSMYATEIDTVEDLTAANARLAQRPAFDVRVDGLRLAV